MSVGQTVSEYERIYERVGELAEEVGNGMPGPSAMRDLAVRWLDAWNNHDVDTMVACTTEDIVMDDPTALGLVARGQDEFRSFCGDFIESFPDIHFEIPNRPCIGVDEPRMAVQWRMSGTFMRDFTAPAATVPLAATGRSFAIDGLDLYEFRGDRICSWRLYYDAYAMSVQLGLAPPLDGRLMRMLAPTQRMRAALMRRRARRQRAQ